MKVITIDFGGSSIKGALFENGKILKKDAIPAHSEKPLKSRLADTKEMIFKLLEGDDTREYDGVAIAMPGIVDPDRKRVTGIYEKYEDAGEVDLEQWCREAFLLPMVMEMDSKSALLGEMYYGCGIGYEDAVMLILGTGVGTAAAINGKILDSRNHVAGALASHIILEMDGDKCTCPNKGCVEASASGWALPRMIKADKDYAFSGLSKEQKLDFHVLEKWYQQGDMTAKRVVERCVKVWRTGILNMIHAYDPAIVILSGAIMQFRGLYEMLKDGIEDLIWDCCGTVAVKKAENPTESVLYGLYHLAAKTYGNKGSK
ncbi:MAG: ROK family protein [Eubacteriales bacterium]|nr:ROK family protein [Eubacteriales bacterium]